MKSDSKELLPLRDHAVAWRPEGAIAADVYVITLGLIETWRITGNGLHACN